MPPEALRATDPIRRKIEEVFATFGFFYDRRKGYYKDLGKSAVSIVSVRDVLQARPLAIALRKPDDAREGPANYSKGVTNMKKYLDRTNFQWTYLKCTELVREVEAFKVKQKHQDHLLNLLFYAALCVACKIISNAHVPPNLLNSLNVADATDALIGSCYGDMFAVYEECGGTDGAAKSVAMRKRVVGQLGEDN